MTTPPQSLHDILVANESCRRDEVLALLQKLKRELEAIENKYFFTEIHKADCENNPIGEGVFDYLYKAEKAIYKLEALLTN